MRFMSRYYDFKRLYDFHARSLRKSIEGEGWAVEPDEIVSRLQKIYGKAKTNQVELQLGLSPVFLSCSKNSTI